MPKTERNEQFRQAERALWAEAGALPTERFVELPGAGLKVRVQEFGDGPPILFVHGGPNAGSSWASLVAGLPGFRCIVLDRPGTGLSDGYQWKRAELRDVFDHLVVQVLDALELEQAHLIGSSTGSDFVLLAGARHPERVLRSVHIGCPGFAPGMRVPFVMRLFSQPGLWRLAARLPQSEKGLLVQMRQMGHGASVDEGRISKAMLQWFIALHQHTDTSHNEMQGSAALMTLRGILPSLVLTPEDLASVESSSYFLWGEHDVFGPPDVGRQMVDLMPHAQLEVLPKAGHLAWLDAPEYAATVVRRHLLGESSERVKATGVAKQSLPAG